MMQAMTSTASLPARTACRLRRRASAGVAAAAAALLIAAGPAAAVRIPRAPNLPVGWSHAEINIVIRRIPHTLTYDRGRVSSVAAESLTLLEPDGSVQTISVSPTALVTIAGQQASLVQVRPGEIAITVSVDGAPAVSVKVQVPPRLAVALGRGPRR